MYGILHGLLGSRVMTGAGTPAFHNLHHHREMYSSLAFHRLPNAPLCEDYTRRARRPTRCVLVVGAGQA